VTARAPEFSRVVDVRHIDTAPMRLVANSEECAALAVRFGLNAIAKFTVEITLAHDKPAILAKGILRANIIQSCAISSEDLPVTIHEKINLRFVPAEALTYGPDEEIEISADDCDEIPFDGGRFDLGEELAQTLAMLIDPFATGPAADNVREKGLLISEAANGPFAGLAGLKKS
jgi:Large ribosomal RNA subunit accumulation protein YceD